MSVVESCLVLAIASVTMAVASPSLIRSRETYVLNAAARDVATKLYAARVHAIIRNRDCRFRVVSAGAYLLECQGAEWETIERADLPRGITVTANGRPEFHRRGYVAPTATISVWGPAGRVKRIVVNVNGRVRIQ